MREQRYFYPTKKTTLADRIFRRASMILVTGGTGLVGSHLLYHLTKENDTIRAIYRTPQSLEAVKKVFSYFTKDVEVLFSKIDWVEADITDIPSLRKVFKGIDIVYHAAALVSFDDKEYLKMRQINIEGTANIVNFSIEENVQKLCYVSSIATLGNAIGNNLVTEEDEWNPENKNNGYAITKYGAEMEVWRASQEGLDVFVVNPGVILGAGFWNVNTGQLFFKVANGFKFYTEGVTGFVSANDVARAMITLMKSNKKNERFILVSENKSFKNIFDVIAKEFGKKPPSIKVSKTLSFLLSKLDAVVSFILQKPRLITSDSAKSMHNKTNYSSEKISKAVGFSFTPIDDVIQEVCKMYVKEK